MRGPQFRGSGAAPFADNFNRANENLEASANWTHDGLIAGAMVVSSNRLRSTTSDLAGSGYLCPDVGIADHYVQYTAVDNPQGSGSFACCRMTDRGNFVGIRNHHGTLEVFRRVGGTLAELHLASQGIVAGDLLRLECEGTNYRAYVNGDLRASGAIGDATLTSTRQGVVSRYVSATWADNFEAGAL